MRVSVPSDVLVQDTLGDESVFLNLNTERYFGLDKVGTCMWKTLTTSESIQAAYEALLAEYDVEADLLRRDLIDLIERLLAQGLVEVRGE